MDHFADRLCAAVRLKGNPLCVGIDPRWEMLPLGIQNRFAPVTPESAASAFEWFSLRLLEIIAPLVPVVKPQSAFFECCGPEGLVALRRVIQKARELNLIVILDSKRGDIASTALAYADAALSGVRFGQECFPIWDADAITVHPYLGRDAIEPFLESARKSGRGVFVLVRTSNAGSGQFQNLVADGQPLYLHVARAVEKWSGENVGASGYGDVGAVVGATHPSELALARDVLAKSVLLIPGYGAQGGTAADIRAGFHSGGMGAIVNSSRGITFPFKPSDKDWESQIELATRKAIAELTSHTSRREK